MSEQGTILVVEDEPALSSLLCDYLGQAGFDTNVIDDGSLVIQAVKDTNPELLLLDIMLPGKDGMRICREIRQFSNVPIIMVTARVEEIDRLLGLELGADDYVCKPFSPREIVARVKAVLRRNQTREPVVCDIVIDDNRHQVSIKGNYLELTAVEFELMKILAADPGRIYSRSQLMDRIYHDHRIVSERTIDSHVKKLRRKIASVLPDEEIIHSIYGVGYKYEP
jgi:two-component system response regulator BaeR